MSTTVSRPPTSRHWRTALALGLVVVLGLAGAWYYYSWTRQHALDSLRAQLDRDDPGWRFKDVVEGRPAVPAERDAAVVVLKLPQLHGKRNFEFPADADKLFHDLHPAAQLDMLQVEALEEHLGKQPALRAEALKLKDRKEGRFPITYTRDWVGTLLMPLQQAREACEILRYDAMLRAHEGDLAGAVQACQGILNVGRATADEPLLIAYMIMAAEQALAAEVLERVLAQGESPAEALRVIQFRLEEDQAPPWLLRALRGERAGYERMFDALDAGHADPGMVLRATARRSLGAWEEALHRHVPMTAGLDRLAFLRASTRMVDTARLPTEQQVEAFDSPAVDVRDAKLPTTFLFKSPGELGQLNGRHQAVLRCAATAVGAERFRQKEGRWPADADELVRAGLLESAPVDPFDARPLRWRRIAGGLVIYSVGQDNADNGGVIDWRNTNRAGLDVGFRLWDVDARRQPPVPRPPEEQQP